MILNDKLINFQEKKAILKQIKTTGATRDLATSEYGHLILLAIFDSVDDTVLVKKVNTFLKLI